MSTDPIIAEAAVIADALGETDTLPRQQILELAQSCGIDVVRALFKRAQEVQAEGGMPTLWGHRMRTIGGVFFQLAMAHFDGDRTAYKRAVPSYISRTQLKRALNHVQPLPAPTPPPPPPAPAPPPVAKAAPARPAPAPVRARRVVVDVVPPRRSSGPRPRRA